MSLDKEESFPFFSSPLWEGSSGVQWDCGREGGAAAWLLRPGRCRFPSSALRSLIPPLLGVRCCQSPPVRIDEVAGGKSCWRESLRRNRFFFLSEERKEQKHLLLLFFLLLQRHPCVRPRGDEMLFSPFSPPPPSVFHSDVAHDIKSSSPSPLLPMHIQRV